MCLHIKLAVAGYGEQREREIRSISSLLMRNIGRVRSLTSLLIRISKEYPLSHYNMYSTEQLVGVTWFAENKEADRCVAFDGNFVDRHAVFDTDCYGACSAGGENAVLYCDGGHHGADHLRAGCGHEAQSGKHYKDHDAAHYL